MIKSGVIGNPIDHSKSPRLHNHWLHILGIGGQYERIYSEIGEFEENIDELVNSGFRGVNVTIPFKSEAAHRATQQSSFVRQNGAANTLVFEKGFIEAHNTDGFGFAQNIWDHYPDWDPSGDHIILGAGGAATAITAWLVNHGANSISIVNRNQQRAEGLKNFGKQISVHSWDDLPELLPNKNTIVNTTSLGMKGKNDIQVDWSKADSAMIVNDIVYTPLETGFLKSARVARLRTVDGIGMLLWQARPGFRAWFGQEAPEIDQGLRNFMLSKHIFALTGSIGMGKSTVAGIFADMGFAIWDADQEVTKLYQGDNELFSFIAKHEPSVISDGKLDKSRWRDYVFTNKEIFPSLEKLIHRKIALSRRIFLESEQSLKLCDIPLLFETGGQHMFDKTITVSATADIQRARVLKRGKMSAEQFEEVVKKQMPDEQKRQLADAVIENSGTIEETRAQIVNLLKNWNVNHA